MSQLNYNVIVAGAGASGLFCSGITAAFGKKVLLLEHNDKPGKKILISGGGRCNFTNRNVTAAHFVSRNPHFVKSALSRYTPEDFIQLVNRYGIEWYEKHKGQLFCKNKASDILNMLLKENENYGVTLRCNTAISSVEKNGDMFTVTTTEGTFTAPVLVIATGGLSIPKMGATGFAYSVAQQFGLQVVEPSPALVGLHPAPELQAVTAQLSGVSLPVSIEAGGTRFTEDLLFTHKGFSGPAVLQISNYCKPGDTIKIDFLPGNNFQALYQMSRKRDPGSELLTLLNSLFPKRFVSLFFEGMSLNTSLAHSSKQTVTLLHNRIHAFSFVPSGTDGFERAEVTGGGIATDELSSKTMEAKKVPGLYFIGEAVDVTGWLGGYNFQWAWASGYCAGSAISGN